MAAKETLIAGHPLARSSLPLLLTLGLGVFAGALDLGVLAPALPALALQFGTSASSLAWVFTGYLLANVVSIPVMAKLSDRYGRRPIYISCVTLFALGSALAIAAPSYPLFLFARIVQALGAGGIFPVATAAIADCTPVERRGAALGLLGAVWGLAAIIGPNVGGIATHFWGWRAIFALNVPLAIVVIALACRYVPAAATRRRGPLDVAGLVVLSIALLATMTALTALDASALFGGPVVAIVSGTIAICALIALIPIERRASDAIIAPRLIANRQVLITYALELGIGILEGALFFIPAALVAAQGLSYAAAGAIASIGALAFVVVIPLAGRMLDRFGSRAVLGGGALFTAAGLALFAAQLATPWAAIAGITIAGVGFGALLGAPTRYIISNETPQEMRATAMGLLSIFLIMGQIVGGSLAGGVIGAHFALPGAYARAYWIFGALALTVAAGALLLRGSKPTFTQKKHSRAAPGT